MVSSVTKLIGKDGMKSLEKGLEPDKKAAKKVKEREEALHATMKSSYGAMKTVLEDHTKGEWKKFLDSGAIV